jgi:hypothetical protein
MNVKRSLVALASTGAVAAVVFGGSAVATSFNSTSDQQYAEGQGATTGVVVSNGTFDAKNLVPGDPGVSVGTVSVGNSSSVPAVATITFGDYTVKHQGSDGGNPDPSALEFNISGIGALSATDLADKSFTLGNFASGQTQSFPVSEDLKAGTGNNWNGADAYLPYTITMTAGS